MEGAVNALQYGSNSVTQYRVAECCMAIQMVQCMQLRTCRVMHCSTTGAVKGTAKTMHRPFNNSGSFKQSLASVIFQGQIRGQPVG